MNFKPSHQAHFTLSIFFILTLLISNCGDTPTGPVSLSLKDINNSADYLIITPEIFQDDLDSFENLKREKGLTVTTVSLSKIVEEFPDAVSLQVSIREFISYTLDFWQEPKPRYVLLVGNTDFIPTFRVQSMFANITLPGVEEDSVSLDELYAINKNEDDTLPDLAIGRFPVANEIELQNIVGKTIIFENEISLNDYSRQGLFLADAAEDRGDVFENFVESLISDLIPGLNEFARIDVRQDSPNHGTQSDLFNRLREGTLLLSYYGFASSSGWSNSDFLAISDVNAFPKNDKPFVLTVFAGSQNYDDPSNKSLVEELVTLKDGGAVISIAPSGLTFVSQLFRFSTVLHNALLNQSDPTIGDIFLETKRTLLLDTQGSQDHTFSRFSILGDPSLRFPNK